MNNKEIKDPKLVVANVNKKDQEDKKQPRNKELVGKSDSGINYVVTNKVHLYYNIQ